MSKPKGSASNPEQDPLHRYKSLVQPLLDRSTEAKNKKLPHEQMDWLSWLAYMASNLQLCDSLYIFDTHMIIAFDFSTASDIASTVSPDI